MACEVHDEPIEIRPAEGDQFALRGPAGIAVAEGSGPFTTPTGYETTWSGTTLTVQVPNRTFRIGPAFGATSFVWCTRA
jgi:hypothetical protein